MFATRVFQAAAIWGVFIILLGYAAYLFGGATYFVDTDHPEYVHGFFLIAFAWQIAFWIISTDPVRYRLFMLAAMLEKFPFTLATLVLYAGSYVPETVLALGLIDGVFGALFGVAYMATDDEAPSA